MSFSIDNLTSNMGDKIGLFHQDFSPDIIKGYSMDDMRKAVSLARSGISAVVHALTSEKPELHNQAVVAYSLYRLAEHWKISLNTRDVCQQILAQLENDEAQDPVVQLYATSLRNIVGASDIDELSDLPDKMDPEELIWPFIMNPSPVIICRGDGNVVTHNPASNDVFPGTKDNFPQELRELISLSDDTNEATVVIDNRIYEVRISRFKKRDRVMLYCTDITERRVLSLLPENRSDPAIILNAESEVVTFIDKTNRIPGLEKGSGLPSDLHKAIGVIQTNKKVEIEFNGHRYLITNSRVPNTGLTCLYFRDITERHNAEIRERRAKDKVMDFSVAMAYAMEGPLANIASAVSMLPDNIKGKRWDYVRSQIGTITTNVRQGLKFVKSMANFSRTTTRINISKEPIDLSELVSEATKHLDMPKNVKYEIINPITQIKTDPAILRDILEKLIDNAISHNNSEKIEIQIGYGRPDNKTYAIYIKDNGVGISDQHTDAVEGNGIFDPFYKVDGNISNSNPGLGLFTAQRAAEALGGKISVKSKPGEESVFFVTIPKK